ncbi:17590_t:CDS:1 [Acaulospora morrowiae]|uniref:17590_t:CDS:1 n=1 Tax=Acaulospora morrowiae TaxID=94023 RepID=A0A9N9D4E8_9GLOM|nr:17590_t:CDS:1 [Acaulospora morrowiae]
MARLTKRQKQVNSLPRKRGCFVPQKEIQEVTEMQEEFISRAHEIGEVVNMKKRVYTKTSRTTIWRQNKKRKDQEKDAKEKKKDILLDAKTSSDDETLTTMSLPSPLSQAIIQNPTSMLSLSQPAQVITQSPTSHIDTSSLYRRLEEVSRQCAITKSSKASVPTYDYLRLLSISKFIRLLLNGKGKMDASKQIAQAVWNKGEYMARCIRKWGDHYLQTGELLTDQQGKHKKLTALSDDNDFSISCQLWLQQQKPESHSPGALKIYIEKTLFPMLEHFKKDTISESTCQNYMQMWGYKYDERRKGIYYDGHERSDVVMYRKE